MSDDTLTRRQLCVNVALAGAAVLAGGAARANEPLLSTNEALSQEKPEGPVRLRLLGTGAADHDWKRIGDPDVKGCTSTLVDGHVLIDCGVTGTANLSRAGVAPGTLSDLVLTHSHGDHFNVGEIRKVIERRDPKLPALGIWATSPLIARLTRELGVRFDGHSIEPGGAFDIGRLHITPLPANHQIAADSTEQALNFLVATSSGNLLYALDTAWMLKPARQLIGKTRLDMIVWDATMSEQTGDYRIFEHNDLTMIRHMEQTLTATGCMDEKTLRVLDHTARTLWPRDLGECRQLASRHGWIFSVDGMELTLGG